MKDARKQDLRTPALTIAAVALVWLALGWLGGQQGWSARSMVLIDLAAMAGFLWALVVTYWIWRRRKLSQNEG
ncbi:MAG: DUF5337 domain-containing protein [Paracoccus sp. (in: a-proteobacteria)]|nr:DUF5337 domain-containing protein [Paracoccus sp. (in: a-proteobacteria)]